MQTRALFAHSLHVLTACIPRSAFSLLSRSKSKKLGFCATYIYRGYDVAN